MDIVVTALSTTPVKGSQLRRVDSIELERGGAVGDRSFYLVDESGLMVNGKRLGGLHSVVADYDPAVGQLSLTFPDGTRVQAPVQYGDVVETSFYSSSRPARELRGPWSEALSRFLGAAVRIVESGPAIDRGPDGAATLISTGSLRRLADVGDRDEIDGRRFRMLIEIDGVDAHAEDGWVGRRVRVGAALLEMRGHVGRCMITTRNPETGDVDLPTLHLLADYRKDLETTEPLPFGVYGAVIEPGRVSIGDPVSLDGAAPRG